MKEYKYKYNNDILNKLNKYISINNIDKNLKKNILLQTIKI